MIKIKLLLHDIYNEKKMDLVEKNYTCIYKSTFSM